MLSSLSIKNFLVIDDLKMDFYDSYSVMTGETGAGKSIIIDALSLLLGERSTQALVKKDCKKAYIEGVFFLKDDLVNYLNTTYDLELEDSNLIISKDVYFDGRSVTKLNGRSISLTLLKDIMKNVIDIHSQFDNQYLLNPKIYINLLDSFLKNTDLEIKEDYLVSYKEYLNLKKELENLVNEQVSEDEVELYKYQNKEIASLDLKENEIEELEEEGKRLANLGKLVDVYKSCSELLNSSNGIISKLYDLKKCLEKVEDDTLFKNLFEVTETCYYDLDDAYSEFASEFSKLEDSEDRLEYINERLYKINNIKRKYGKTYEEIMAKYQNNLTKIELFENYEITISKLEKKLNAAKEVAYSKAMKLSNIRKEVADKLTKSVLNELNDLYLDKCQFLISVTSEEELTPKGIDKVEFLASMNPGMALRPINKVASGGELSRLMLGLKCVFALNEDIETIIFDEVDSGVSGKVAMAIGRKMKKLSEELQVITITHLPQVAALSDYHYHVMKSFSEDETSTSVKLLNKEEHVSEVAKLLAGDDVLESSLKAALDLINR